MNKPTKFITGMLAIFMALVPLVFGMVGCDTGTGGGSSSRDPGDGVPTINTTRYEAVANASGEPDVIDSYTDGTYNYYLLHVGYVKLVPIAYGDSPYYNGVTPIEVYSSTSKVTTKSIEASIEKCFSNTVTNSDTQEYSAGIKVGATYGIVSGELSAGWKGSWTNAEAKSYSTTNTYTTAESLSTTDTNTIKYTIGENGEAVGSYRLTWFATCDMYLFLKLNANNTQVIEVLESAYARPASYRPLIDYDPDISGEFKKNSNSSSIKVDPDFYKELEIPTKTVKDPVVETPALKTSSSVYVYGGDSIKIDDNSGQKHTDNTHRVGLDIDALKQVGYTKINMAMDIQIRAQDTGDGRKIWLDIDNERVWLVENLNVTNKSWYNVKYNHSVDINSFKNDSRFRFGFSTKEYFLNDAIWYFNEANVTFTATK
jgi:hypothetical protein